MANRTQVLLLIAAVTGLNPMTVELILRYLGKVGLVPKGLPGRRSAHYSTEHLKNLILALAAYQPSESVEAVQKLNDLHCNTNALANLAFSPEIPAISKGVLFGNWIMAEIEARISRTEPELTVAEQEIPPQLRRGRTITMSILPPSAFTTRPVYGADGTVQYYTDFFGSKDPLSPTTPALRRQTTFTDELLNAAGDLLADTLAAQAAIQIPDPAPGRAGEGDATPETTKAAGSGNHDGLQLEHPATQTRRRAPLNKAQPTASQGRKQSCPDGAVSELRGSYPPAPTPITMARFGLTQLPRKVSEHTGHQAPTYRKCFDGAVAARFPAEFANNRWTWDDADLDVIARALGMVSATEVSTPTRAAHAAVKHAAA